MYLGVGLKGFTVYFIEMVTEYSWWRPHLDITLKRNQEKYSSRINELAYQAIYSRLF